MRYNTHVTMNLQFGKELLQLAGGTKTGRIQPHMTGATCAARALLG